MVPARRVRDSATASNKRWRLSASPVWRDNQQFYPRFCAAKATGPRIDDDGIVHTAKGIHGMNRPPSGARSAAGLRTSVRDQRNLLGLFGYYGPDSCLEPARDLIENGLQLFAVST